MLNSELILKAGVKHKRAMCAMHSEYLLKVLAAFIEGYVHDFSVGFKVF